MTDPAYRTESASSSAGRRDPTIAIIGMDGSGKTVLVTTLAKRLSTIDERGIFLNPQGVKTLKYVEDVWHILQSGDWPRSTPQGEMFNLRWKFQIVGELECDVRLIDASGQDLRKLYGYGQMIDAIGSLPGELQSLAEYCRAADIILFLINLGDFIGQGDPAKVTANEAAIKDAMDRLTADGRQKSVCLVLTQFDQYREMAEKKGGPLALTAEAIPYVFSAHVKVNGIAVYPVSAVANLTVSMEGDRAPCHVPAPGFRSEGLDDLVDWIIEQLRSVTAQEQQRKMEEQRIVAVRTQEEEQQARRTAEAAKTQKELAGSIKGIVGFVLVLILIIKGCSWLVTPSKPIATVTWPGGAFDYPYGPNWIVGKIKIQNTGAAGNIRLKVWAQDLFGNEIAHGENSVYFNAGEEKLIEADAKQRNDGQTIDLSEPHADKQICDVP